MSLTNVFSDEKRDRIIAVMSDEMIVWKCVEGPFGTHPLTNNPRIEDKWHPWAWPNYFCAGLNVIKDHYRIPIDRAKYGTGFHSFIKKARAQELADVYTKEYDHRVISALIHKSDITTIGDEGHGNLVVVTSKIVLPTYPNTDILTEIEPALTLESVDEAMELMLCQS